jgi:hypothetical protein
VTDRPVFGSIVAPVPEINTEGEKELVLSVLPHAQRANPCYRATSLDK